MRLFIFTTLLVPFLFYSQKSKSDSTFEYTYFKTGKISTKRLLLSEKIKFGYLIAYNIEGKEIYNMSTRNVGGHASVSTTFYENGAIKTAHYTSQPDGGIQRGDVKHYFDEKGNITNVVDMSDDGHGRMTVNPILKFEQLPNPTKEIEPEKPKNEVAECAIIYKTEIYAVNFTRKTQVLSPIKKPSNGQEFSEKYTIQPGDSVKIGYYIGAQHYVPAPELFSATLEQKKKVKTNNPYHLVWDSHTQIKNELRHYHLLIVEKYIK